MLSGASAADDFWKNIGTTGEIAQNEISPFATMFQLNSRNQTHI